MTTGTALEDTLVSVVIPAYNCAATIDETLASVRAQTHRKLEIIVVDDGSKDSTVSIAQGHAVLDDRVRVIRQANGGVAAARNAGLEAAQGEFVAPVDADDLWRPRKIERQLRVLIAAGEQTALVYCWNAVIDKAGAIISPGDRPVAAGDVIPRLFYGNMVGNGSCPMMRRAAVLAVGGYDTSLRARGAQGCEDWKLYLALAEKYLFAVIPDHLVGYRFLAHTMSGDISQMLRSDALVRAEFAERHPEHRDVLAAGRRYYIEWLLDRAVEAGNWQRCLMLLNEWHKGDSPHRRDMLRWQRQRVRCALRRITGAPRAQPAGAPFLSSHPPAGAAV